MAEVLYFTAAVLYFFMAAELATMVYFMTAVLYAS